MNHGKVLIFFKFYHLTLFVLTKKICIFSIYFVYMYYIGFLFTEFYFWLIVIQKK